MKKTVTVFCASSTQVDSAFFDDALRLGKFLAAHGYRCVYGAGKVGLMGSLAEGVLSSGGEIVGVIPQKMVDMNLQHTALTDMIVTPNMNVRKETMIEMADVVVALPGGAGTFEELLDAISWKKLSLTSVKIVIYNQKNYFSPLLQMFQNAIDEQFMHKEDMHLWSKADTFEQLQAEILK